MLSAAQRSIRREHRIKLLFLSSLFVLIIALFAVVDNLGISFILALVSYNILSPSVDFFERHGFSRLTATIIPFAILTLAFVLSGVIFSQDLLEQIRALEHNYKPYIAAANNLVLQLEQWMSQLMHFVELSDLQAKTEAWLTAKSTDFFSSLPQFISRLLSISIMAPFLAFFMLLDGRNFLRRVIGLVPNNFFELALNLNHQIGTQIGGFIRARIIESVIIGLVIWIGLAVIGVPYSLVLAVFAALMNIIPYIGPVIGLIPALLVAMGNGQQGSELIPILVVYGIGQLVDNVILVPFLVARLVNLHPVTVVLSFLVGAQVFGIIGMIICIPVVSITKVTFEAFYLYFTDYRA